MLRRSSLVECVSVLPGNRCLQNVEFFFLRQYVQPCLLKNPKYKFYTIKSSLKLAYYADLEKFQFKKMCILCFVFNKFFKFSVIIQVIFMSAITMFCIYILIKHHPSFLPIYRYICLIFHIFSRKIKCIGRVQSSTR